MTVPFRLYQTPANTGDKTRVLAIGCPKCEHEIEVPDMVCPEHDAMRAGLQVAIDECPYSCLNGDCGAEWDTELKPCMFCTEARKVMEGQMMPGYTEMRKLLEQVLHARQCNAPYGQTEKYPSVEELKRVLRKTDAK